MEASELIGRLEAASEGSAELSARVFCAAFAPAGSYVERSRFNGAWCVYEPRDDRTPRLFQGAWREGGWPVTTSLDAVVALIERKLPGWEWHALESPSHNDGAGCSYAGLTPPGETRARHPVALRGRRPALALCIALLGSLHAAGQRDRAEQAEYALEAALASQDQGGGDRG